jgi:hypothetical protein
MFSFGGWYLGVLGSAASQMITLATTDILAAGRRRVKTLALSFFDNPCRGW